MGSNTLRNLKLCFPYENDLRGKNFAKHLKSKAHLIETEAKVVCQKRILL